MQNCYKCFRNKALRDSAIDVTGSAMVITVMTNYRPGIGLGFHQRSRYRASYGPYLLHPNY